MDKGILPVKGETADTFLTRAERIQDSARRFDPTLPFTYNGHEIRPEYGYGCEQFSDETVKQLYEADVSWMPVVGVNPKHKPIFGSPRSSVGTVKYILDNDRKPLSPFSLFYTASDDPFNQQSIPHERVHGMRDDLPDDILHHEFYAYATGGNVRAILGFTIPLVVASLTITPSLPIPTPAFFKQRALYAFQKTLQKAERALSDEFGIRAARYVIGRASFAEAKKIARCSNGLDLEGLLQEKANADLRWELLQRKLSEWDEK